MTDGGIGQDVSRTLRAVALTAIAAAVIACWWPRLVWGLWLDETFSAWQAGRGWADIARATRDNPGQSVLFGYIEALVYFPRSPHMELWLRVPAVVGALLSGFLTYRLAEAFVGAGTGLIALVPFVGNPEVIRLACQARPYTLATAACLASVWALHRWLERGQRRHALLFSASLALVPYLHLLYAILGLVPLALLAGHVGRGRRVEWRALFGPLGLLVLLLLPLIPLIRDFGQRSAGLSFLPSPGAQRLVETLTPVALIPALVALLIVVVRVGKQGLRWRVKRDVVELSLVWLLAPPVILFVLSRVAGQTVLIERYFLYTVAAQGLLVAALFGGFPRTLATLAVLACFLPLPVLASVKDWKRVDGFDSWRLPVRTVSSLDPAAHAPVFVQSGHPLSDRADWRHAPEQGSFLFSQLAVYPFANRVYPVPFTLDPATKEYVRAVADEQLARADLIFVAGEPRRPTVEWLRRFFEARGYASAYAVRQGTSLVVLRKVSGPR